MSRTSTEDSAPREPTEHEPGEPPGHSPGAPPGHPPGEPPGLAPGEPPGLAPGEPPARASHNPHGRPRTFVPQNEHQRIQAAVALVVAAHGYEATTVQDICAQAHISTRTFYEHFSGKQEAALSTLEAGVDLAMADCRAAFQAAPTWPEAIWAAFEVYTDWFAGEPAFARLAVVEMLTAGQPALELMQSLMDAFAMFLKPGYAFAPEGGPSQAVVDETVANAVFGLLHEHLVRESAETVPRILPEIVRTVLAPFLGVAAAAEFVEAKRRASDPREAP